MRQLAIFIVSLPLLALAVTWIPLAIVFCVVASPLWGMLGVLMILRGQRAPWDIFLVVPMIGFSMYSNATGLLGDPVDYLMKH